MTSEQIRALLKIGEEALRKAQAVFAAEQDPHNEEDISDPPLRWAHLLAHFMGAPNQALTVEQVRHAARESGFDPRGLGAFYNIKTGWLRSEEDLRVLTDAGRHWFETVGKRILNDPKGWPSAAPKEDKTG